jgi:hypothetical protein
MAIRKSSSENVSEKISFNLPLAAKGEVVWKIFTDRKIVLSLIPVVEITISANQ